jgi:dynein heavy chain
MCSEDRIETPEAMVRLWQHEIWRTFADRLVNNEDKKIVLDLSIKTVKSAYSMTYDKVFEKFDFNGDGKVDTVDEIRGLMFADLLCPPGAKKVYEEIEDIKVL